jgi:hypothetical protein
MKLGVTMHESPTNESLLMSSPVLVRLKNGQVGVLKSGSCTCVCLLYGQKRIVHVRVPLVY